MADVVEQNQNVQTQADGGYSPPGPAPRVFEAFQGINTSTSRVGVKDEQMWWCDGWFPIGPRCLRTLYGVGALLWSAPAGTTIVFFDFANIGATAFAVVFLSDGSVYQVNTTTGVATLMAPAGTIQNPSVSSIGFTQYGSQYVIFTNTQTHGYWVWDGSVLYSYGSINPVITITNAGSGYNNTLTAAISGGSGSGAVLSVTVSGGVVSKITVTSPGSGYLPTDTVTVAFSGGGGSAAAATATVFAPLAFGNAIETYQGRVWVANGALLAFSAPGSFSDFSTASGGGTTLSSDSFLRVGYTQLLSTNGFLYLIGDSSINYISGVQTSSGSPPITTFTNQNADPEVGTVWPNTVDTFGRNIVFANAFGAHISYGASVTKISTELDGVYNTLPNFAGILPSAAKSILFGKKVWVLLLPVIDPITGQQANKLFIWTGKVWVASSQDVTITYIQHQEINSVLTAWGTDGINLYPLFASPSTNFTKTVQSRLWDDPVGYEVMKSSTRLWGLVQYYNFASPTVNISIDNETSAAPTFSTVPLPTATWTNASGQTVTWTNFLGQPVTWLTAGGNTSVFAPDAVAQNGVMIGLTIDTNCADMALLSFKLHNTPVSGRW